MPEGDTIWQLADRITDRFVGETCHDTVTRHPKLLRVDFAGQRLVAAESIGSQEGGDSSMHGLVGPDRAIARNRARRRRRRRCTCGCLNALENGKCVGCHWQW